MLVTWLAAVLSRQDRAVFQDSEPVNIATEVRQQTVTCWLQWEKIAFPHQSLCLRKGRQLDNCSVGQRQTLILSFKWEKTLGKSYGFLK